MAGPVPMLQNRASSVDVARTSEGSGMAPVAWRALRNRVVALPRSARRGGEPASMLVSLLVWAALAALAWAAIVVVIQLL